MANIAVDIGNTLIKCGVFVQKELVELKAFTIDEEAYAYIAAKKPENIIVANVTQKSDFINTLKSISTVMLLTSAFKTPLINKYETPETLGPDRLAAAVGAYSLFKNNSILNIDTGTCIKYNFISSNGEFIGGAIAPGIKMRYQSLNAFTGKLPLLEPNFNLFKMLGQNTEESIHSGVMFSVIAEILNIIGFYSNLFPEIKIVVSGGDTVFLAKHLKNTIFAHQNLVLTGLNEILLYNI